MARQMKAARLFSKLTMVEAGEKLGVSQPTLSAWEAERKSPSIDALERMADLYGVTTDFLLGRPEAVCHEPTESINTKLLSVLNGMPVWSERHGWMLVCAGEHRLQLSSGKSISFNDVGELYISPKAFASVVPPLEEPLDKSELVYQTEIWLEPISPDTNLRVELRGWYHISNGFAENNVGNRFSLDSYGAKWLAFSNNAQAEKNYNY